MQNQNFTKPSLSVIVCYTIKTGNYFQQQLILLPLFASSRYSDGSSRWQQSKLPLYKPPNRFYSWQQLIKVTITFVIGEASTLYSNGANRGLRNYCRPLTDLERRTKAGGQHCWWLIFAAYPRSYGVRNTNSLTYNNFTLQRGSDTTYHPCPCSMIFTSKCKSTGMMNIALSA